MKDIASRLTLALLFFLAAVGLAYWAGYTDGAKTRPAAVVKAATREAAKVAVKMNAGDAVAAVSAKQDAERAVTEKVVTRWIVKHVKAEATTAVPGTDDDWLRGHDGAALGADPATLVPSAVHGAAAQPDRAEVLLTIADNYDLARTWRDRYQSCRVQLAQELGKPDDWIALHLTAQ